MQKFALIQCSVTIYLFSIRNLSLISKVESRKLAGTLDSCFVLFGILQQCAPTEPGGNRTRDLTVRKPVSNRCTTSTRSRLEFSNAPINDTLRELSSIVLYVYLFHQIFIRSWRMWLDKRSNFQSNKLEKVQCEQRCSIKLVFYEIFIQLLSGNHIMIILFFPLIHLSQWTKPESDCTILRSVGVAPSSISLGTHPHVSVNSKE